MPDVSRSVDVLPDVREIGGWVYASRPVEVESDPESLTVVRLRQVVGPDGSFEESEDRISLYRIDRHSLADELEADGFLRVHKGYLVNLRKVKEMSAWFSGSYTLILESKTKSQVPLSRRYVTKFREATGF